MNERFSPNVVGVKWARAGPEEERCTRLLHKVHNGQYVDSLEITAALVSWASAADVPDVIKKLCEILTQRALRQMER